MTLNAAFSPPALTHSEYNTEQKLEAVSSKAMESMRGRDLGGTSLDNVFLSIKGIAATEGSQRGVHPHLQEAESPIADASSAENGKGEDGATGEDTKVEDGK